MGFSSLIEHAITQTGQWLLSIRSQGGWQDMVYKQQGILNTAEAWRSLVLVQSVIPEITWSKAWVEEDWQRVAQAVGAHGFERSPYCPTDRSHESVDAAGFVVLMFQSLFLSEKTTVTPSMQALYDDAINWLIDNQSSTGGWGWGMKKPGRPLYPYFTFMALGALRRVQIPRADKAIASGLQWFIEAQRADGSFTVHDTSDEPDIASTAYAAIALSQSKHTGAHTALSRAIRYLLSAPWSDMTHLGHLKIVESGQPPQLGIAYENYAVAADVLLALVKAQPHLKPQPQLDDRIQFLAHDLLDQKEPSAGWPKTYSTLYVTHTVIEALVAYRQWAQNRRHLGGGGATEHFNPYIFGFPIQPSHLFFGRADVIRRIGTDVNTPPATKRDLALIGERRIGKTSLLYQLRSSLELDGHLVFYLDLQLMQSVGQFLQAFVAQMGEVIFGLPGKGNFSARFSRAYHRMDRALFRQLDLQLQTPFVSVSTHRTPDLFRLFLADVRQLLMRYRKWETESNAKIICLLDEIAYLRHFGEDSLYSLLRGLSQEMADLVFIVAGTPKACRILTDAASPFYNIFTPIPVGRLQREPAIELITAPVRDKMSYTPAAIERLLQESDQHPYTLQMLCYHCIRLLPASVTVVDEQTVGSAIQMAASQNQWK